MLISGENARRKTLGEDVTSGLGLSTEKKGRNNNRGNKMGRARQIEFRSIAGVNLVKGMRKQRVAGTKVRRATSSEIVKH